MNFFEKIQRGAAMTSLAYTFCSNHKKIFLFTLIPSFLIAQIARKVIKIFAVDTNLLEMLHNSFLAPGEAEITLIGHKSLLLNSLSTLFTFWIVFLFVNPLMQVALSYYVSKTLQDEEVGFFSALFRAVSRIFTIILWVLLNIIIGNIIESIAGNPNQQNSNSPSFVRSLISGLLTLAWRALTFFVIPIIALEDFWPIKTIEASGAAMKKTFGETVTATFSLGAFNHILSSIVFLFLLTIAGLFWLVGGPSSLSFFIIDMPLHSNPSTISLWGQVLMYIGSFTFFLVTPVTMAATVVFKTAAYHYSQHKPMGPFSETDIKESFIGSLNAQ